MNSRERPNILLIMSDQHNARVMGCPSIRRVGGPHSFDRNSIMERPRTFLLQHAPEAKTLTNPSIITAPQGMGSLGYALYKVEGSEFPPQTITPIRSPAAGR